MMNIARNLPDAIVDLDRKVSRAMERGRGLSLSADQLDVLAGIGLVDRLAEAKATVLKEKAKFRQTKVVSTPEASSGSIMIEPPEVDQRQTNCTSSGTTAQPGTSVERQRARQMFG